MFNLVLIVEILVYGFTAWFGFYLISRDPRKPGLRFAGLGLIAYAAGLSLDIVSAYVPATGILLNLSRWRWPLVFLPALFWTGAALHLLPELPPRAARLSRVASYIPLPAILGLYLVALSSRSPTPPPWLYWTLVALVGALLALALWLVISAAHSGLPARSKSAALTATLFFTLGMGLLLLDWLPRELVVLAIGGDMIVLGMVVAGLDAFDQGETLLRDFLRAFAYALVAALFFAGQIVLVAGVIMNTFNVHLLVVLLVMIASSVAVTTFANPIQDILDRFMYRHLPQVQRERAGLRAVASALPRLHDTLDLHSLDEAEFARLTRRALSAYGDLSRLAESPLTRLPIIAARLSERGEADNTLARAAELKTILTDSIARLKPRSQDTEGGFGTTDEWRFYNALYYPYVAGLKPYSLRADHNGLDPETRALLDWFQSAVPERTLYNWQNAAARLVAQDLREQMRPR